MSILRDVMLKQDNNTSYWYWDTDADMAIYASLLLSRGDIVEANRILEELNYRINPRSYYVSTQTKIQFFVALIRQAKTMNNMKGISLSVKSD